jgi:hypothetical protein
MGQREARREWQDLPDAVVTRNTPRRAGSSHEDEGIGTRRSMESVSEDVAPIEPARSSRYDFVKVGCGCGRRSTPFPPRLAHGCRPMSAQLHLDLNDRQRELLLRGLRFVRSSRMLEFRELSEISEDQRRDELGEIRQLSELLDTKKRRAEPATV